MNDKQFAELLQRHDAIREGMAWIEENIRTHDLRATEPHRWSDPSAGGPGHVADPTGNAATCECDPGEHKCLRGLYAAGVRAALEAVRTADRDFYEATRLMKRAEAKEDRISAQWRGASPTPAHSGERMVRGDGEEREAAASAQRRRREADRSRILALTRGGWYVP